MGGRGSRPETSEREPDKSGEVMNPPADSTPPPEDDDLPPLDLAEDITHPDAIPKKGGGFLLLLLAALLVTRRK